MTRRYDGSVGRARRIFYPALGAFFVELRGATSQRSLVAQAARRGLRIGYQTLRDLEDGKLQHLTPDLLRALATLYRQPYDSLVLKFVEAAFGLSEVPAKIRDQIAHSREITPAYTHPALEAARDVDAALPGAFEHDRALTQIAKSLDTVIDRLIRVRATAADALHDATRPLGPTRSSRGGHGHGHRRKAAQ